MSKIDPSAVIDPAADLDADVEVGPFVVIEGPVRIASGARLLPGAQVIGDCEIGARTVVGRGVIIGELPQSVGFDPAVPSGVRIGEDNVLREHVTIHRGLTEGSNTVMGDSNFLMVNTHLGHDVQMGDHNIMANDSGFGGHCVIEDHCFIGGGALFHQYIRVGKFCMVQGHASVSQDAPPFCTVAGLNGLCGLNAIGLRRGGMTPPERAEIKAAYKAVFKSDAPIGQSLEEASARPEPWGDAAAHFLKFLSETGPKGFCTPRARRA